jgi:exodeoxyribonuclease-5
MLTEMHRQAADNPIIRMSMDVRQGGRLQAGTYGDSRVVRRAEIGRDELGAIVLQADQVLCGRNNTRQAFNMRIRALRGIASALPIKGDRLVCLKNNREKGLLNGGIWEALEVDPMRGHCEMRVKSLDEPEMPPVDVRVFDEFWRGEEKNIDWRRLRDFEQFTFGYALTVHKSQGSQWDDIAVFDESAAFREHAPNHLYTGITRAAERITVVV